MLLTINRHRRIERVLALLGCRLRVWLGDEDVTDRCFVADEEQGYVGLLVKDGDGTVQIVDNNGRLDAARQIHVGDVQYVVVDRNGRRVRAVMTAEETAAL